MPYLVVDDAAKAIEFYQKVFDAKAGVRLDMPGGKVGHAELQIGDSMIMLADEFPEMDALSPKTVGGTPMSIALYVADVDATVKRAVDGGATITKPIQDQFYGNRSGTLIDPFGHKWSIATHIEDVSDEEMKTRAAKLFGGG
jgi:PhnB protein